MARILSRNEALHLSSQAICEHPQPVLLGEARTWRVTVAEQAWRLWIDRPAHIDLGAETPVIWTLDGAETFPLVAATVRRLSRRPETTGVPPCLVIGIDREPADKNSRWLDATAGPSSDPERADTPHGGAEALLDLIAGPLTDAVATADSPHVLIGHSLMGLTALYAAATRPAAFHAFGAISPSIWWNPDAVLAGLDAMPDVGQRVFLAVGQREEPVVARTADETRRLSRRMVANARVAAARLSARLGPHRARLDVAPDEDHASVLPAVLPRLLRFALRT